MACPPAGRSPPRKPTVPPASRVSFQTHSLQITGRDTHYTRHAAPPPLPGVSLNATSRGPPGVADTDCPHPQCPASGRTCRLELHLQRLAPRPACLGSLAPGLPRLTRPFSPGQVPALAAAGVSGGRGLSSLVLPGTPARQRGHLSRRSRFTFSRPLGFSSAAEWGQRTRRSGHREE